MDIKECWKELDSKRNLLKIIFINHNQNIGGLMLVANLLSFLRDGLGLAYLPFLGGLFRTGWITLVGSFVGFGSTFSDWVFLAKNQLRGFCIVTI